MWIFSSISVLSENDLGLAITSLQSTYNRDRKHFVNKRDMNYFDFIQIMKVCRLYVINLYFDGTVVTCFYATFGSS